MPTTKAPTRKTWTVYTGHGDNRKRVFGHDHYEICIGYIEHNAPKNPTTSYTLIRTPNAR